MPIHSQLKELSKIKEQGGKEQSNPLHLTTPNSGMRLRRNLNPHQNTTDTPKKQTKHTYRKEEQTKPPHTHPCNHLHFNLTSNQRGQVTGNRLHALVIDYPREKQLKSAT